MSNPDDADWVWFPNVKSAWSLDVVNLLVVIGESSIAEHAQTITASLPGMLPRILPAPQALLKPARPTRMPETHARMTGVYSGTTLDSVGFFANIITPLDSMPPFSFKVLEIKHSDTIGLTEHVPMATKTTLAPFPALAAGIWRFVKRAATARKIRPKAGSGNGIDDNLIIGDGRQKHHRHGCLKPQRDEESGCSPPAAAASAHKTTQANDGATTPSAAPTDSSRCRRPTVQFTDKGDDTVSSSYSALPRRRPTARERAQDLLTSPTVAVGGSRPAVPAKLFSPVHILSIFSCLLSIAIVAMGVVRHDGVAVLAVSLISLASTVVGYASFWRPILMKRKHTNEVPRGDVLIRTREGAFVLVRCSEEVARELYSGTEECEYYVSGNTYRALMAVGTMLLMLSVVLLGNCTWELKVFIGTSYIILNGLYWGLGMIPRSYFWDLSRYEWADVTPEDSVSAHQVTCVTDQREGHPSFTRTLWYAIRETQLTGWVERSGAAPGTEQWKKWLHEAEEAAKRNERTWPAVQRKNEILKEKLRNGHEVDQAAQHAPVTEVRGSAEDSGKRWTKDGTF
ncbi:hypothetical protein E4U43_008562 [Claviceps pusilla]|uniref:Uncharacterized protein n=1 Tax=Claviceps pusilla TaxID=123648 RepID=A0A9P7SZK8_9HYPO|nr:hypothetical protein E4U43_008562 [Claviceps pusilla]